MAAHPKSPLRSSNRLHPGLARPIPVAKAATDTAQSGPATRLGKRLRPPPPILADENGRQAKRIRTEHAKVSLPRIATRGPAPAAEAPHGRGAALLPRSRVTTSAAQPRPKNASTTNGVQAETLTNGDANVEHAQLPPRVTTSGQPPKELERRALRSHNGGSRCRSDLALYFPNYDEFISNEPQDTELLTHDTRLYITEEPPKSPTTTQNFVLASPPPKTHRSPSTSLASPTYTPLKPPSSPIAFRKLDLGTGGDSPPIDDPLPATLFERAHHRAERQEKQLRNIEKERAQHEKVQLERLLEGLKGPDWLRVMGISGIVESERALWADKRGYFIREVRALIEKFRQWKEEERRRKLEKEETSVQDEEEEEEEDAEEDAEEMDPVRRNGRRLATPSHGTSSTDADDPAAQQLHNETLSASAKKTAGKQAGPLGGRALEPPPVERPFTSFFAKPHQRAAALEKNRRSGRVRFAFGQPVPDMAERNFALPREFITAESLKASARSRRLQRRNVQPASRTITEPVEPSMRKARGPETQGEQ